MSNFWDELTALINFYGIDAETEVPDYILCEFIKNTLINFVNVQRKTKQFYGGGYNLSDLFWLKGDE